MAGLCPLCSERAATKTLYGHPVCKKCYYRFANRRQLAYLLDSLLFAIPIFTVFFLVGFFLSPTVADGPLAVLGTFVLTVLVQCLFNFKDGFNGQSPGKMATGVQVVDAATQRPIGFGQSFKRNWPFLLGLIPFVGGLVSLIVIIVIIIQMNAGPRFGDSTAGTRVIWRKYADSPVFGGNNSRCRKCQYDLTGNTSGTCPECGTPAIA